MPAVPLPARTFRARTGRQRRTRSATAKLPSAAFVALSRAGRCLATARITGSLLALGLLAAGCQSLGAAAQVVDRSDLVSDLAVLLDQSAELSYLAEYQLPGGATATIAQAQKPRRAAYTFPGGKVVVTAQATTRCTTRPAPTCGVTAPPAANSRSAPTLGTTTGPSAMVTPAAVATLLEGAALDAEATVEQHDTTVAGRHATCVDVRESSNPAKSRFVACVTADGVLGSFQGPLGGRPVEVVLTRYRDVVPPDAFGLPRGATVVDRRARPR